MKGKGWVVLVALTVVSVFVAVGLWFYDTYAREAIPTGVVVASGRLEGRRVRIASAAAGRIARLAVQQGDRVEAGQLIAELDRRDEAAAVDAARAAVAAAEAAVHEAESRVAALQAQVKLARTEAARYRRLFERDAAPRQAAERAEAEQTSLENGLQAARAARLVALREVDRARAQLAAAETQLEETTVKAPVAGTVTRELMRAGEIAAPGVPVVEIIRAGDIKLRVYLPLLAAGRVRPGAEARVYLDAYPDRVFPGTVEWVASEAEFTPNDIHMPDERATLVFAVDIRVSNADRALLDGFPADAYIRWDDSAPWPERRPW